MKSGLGENVRGLKSVEELVRSLDRVPQLFIPRYLQPHLHAPAKQSTSVGEIPRSGVRSGYEDHPQRYTAAACRPIRFGKGTIPPRRTGGGGGRRSGRNIPPRTADGRTARCNDAQLSGKRNRVPFLCRSPQTRTLSMESGREKHGC